ncbi:hypothetical protein GGF46_000172 [Coemansia sp. RSA 552]|nr:hypothetical protein GGF46_000172 [Coemansia sp. RSA 552]
MTLRILHFNDVYHVAAGKSEPVGGASRFGSQLHQLQGDQTYPTLTLFSGDAYFPSLESSISRGEHMLPVLNSLNIDASTLGNHEFDQGIDLLENLIQRNNFPWIITNLTDKETGEAAARHSQRYLVKEIGKVQVGIIGIVEKEWLDTLPCLPPTFVYHDFVQSARDMATWLRKEMGCSMVICLSHMRVNNDIRLADECADVVDLVLGGHDHFYYIGSGIDAFEDPQLGSLPQGYSGHDDDAKTLETWMQERQRSRGDGRMGRRLVKSGTDFRDLSEILLHLDSPGEDGRRTVASVSVTRHRTTSVVPEDPEIQSMVDRIEAHLSKALDKEIGYSTAPLEARSTVCRTRESNVGSLSGDLMRLCYARSAGAQIALLCGGAIRSDKVFAAGTIKLRDVMEIFPFEDPVVVVRLTGDQIRRALENGVSKWPAQEGRFPQVSGIRFEFDPRRAPGDRITSITITAAAKSAAAASGEVPGLVKPSTSQRSVSGAGAIHRLALENASGRVSHKRRESNVSVDSDSDAESDYGGEEDEPLDMDTHYLVATRDYMYQGHDGYDALNEGELVVDEENGITFADLYRRYFRGLAVCNALRFRRQGLAQQCSLVRHAPESPDESQGRILWKRLIIKHAENLRELARQAKRDREVERADDSNVASHIAEIVDRYSGRVAERAKLPTRRNTRIVDALVSSAKRLEEDQEPVRVARSALFGRHDQSNIHMDGDSGSSTPRNDDAGGLMPHLTVNRADTRSHASEGVMARWAVVSPQTDGRIRNIADDP